MTIDPQLQWLLAAVMVVYLVVMYAVGYIAQRKIHDNEDFLVAGRRLPLSMAWMTLLATWFGAGTMLTAADEVRHEGLRAAALDPFGAGCCLLLAGILLARSLWRMRLLTLPDFYRRKFGAHTELLSALIMVPGYFGWIAAQFVALASVLDLFFAIPLTVGIPIVAIVGMGYTLMGGMWSVTLTDAIQITLVLIGLIILCLAVFWHLGDANLASGIRRLWSETPTEMLQPIPWQPTKALWVWAAAFAAGALGNLPGQDLLQRVFASKSEVVAQRACYIAGIVYLSFGLLPLLMGLAANLMFPNVEMAILPALAHAMLHPLVAVVFVIALMSAVLSTIDSAILAPSSVLAQNVFGKISRWNSLTLNRWAVLLVTGCSLALAFVGQDAYELLEGAYEIGLVGLFVPLLLGVYSTPRSQRPALASMITGTGCWLIHYAAGWESFLQPLESIGHLGLPVGLCSAMISLLAYFAMEPPWRIVWGKSE